LPKWFSQVHNRFSSPANSVMFLGGLAMLLALSGSFVRLAIATSLTRLITYLICIAALPVIKRQADDDAVSRSFRIPGGYTIPVVAFILCLWVVSQSPIDSWAMVGGLFVVGLIPFFLTRLRIKKFDVA